jgi:hypothetical protein
MKNLFCPYEQALALKELGFDEPCFGYWFADKINYPNKIGHLESQERCSYITGGMLAPLYQQALTWFREKHNLHANINPVADDSPYAGGFIPNGKYGGTIDDVTIGKKMLYTDTVCLVPTSNSYKEAELACLIKLIEIANK